jgi:hypothetical protein
LKQVKVLLGADHLQEPDYNPVMSHWGQSFAKNSAAHLELLQDTTMRMRKKKKPAQPSG